MSCGDEEWCGECPHCGSPTERHVYPVAEDGIRKKRYMCLDCEAQWDPEQLKRNGSYVKGDVVARDKTVL